VIKEHQPDLVIIAGDITQFGPGDVATLILNQFPEPVFTVPGNIDTADVWEGIKQSHAENLHKTQKEFKGVRFTGINGVDDAETEFFLNDQSLKSMVESSDVLVTHVPPYGFQDAVFLGKHAGSKPLRKIMDMVHPRLVISGHIHEKPGFTSHEETIIVNCSMGKRGRGALISLKDEIEVTMIV
jgi:Icc-related predicted phosphoesterase